MTERKFFGTDGVRAVAGKPPLTPEWVLDLGKAAAEVLKAQNPKPTVVIGCDTRQSGDMLEAALAAGLMSRGASVVHLGVMPTPGVSYLTRHLGATAGVVISASHNPYEDNGIKFFSHLGGKLPDTQELQIEAMLGRHYTDQPVLGTVTDYHEAERLYSDFLLQLAPDLSGLKIVLDCANGATYKLAPRIFSKAGAEVFAIFTAPNGKNINLNCGSTHPSMLKKIVRDNNFDLGIAFDGDGDRAILIDGSGEEFHGDHMLYLNALQRNEKSVVATIMSNMALEVKLQEAGIELQRTAVGDRYVHERMVEHQLSLGGEQSGHVLFLDIAPTGDGILTALQTLKALRAAGGSLRDWRERLPMFPQTLLNVRVTDKQATAKHPEVLAAVSEAEKTLAGRGRVNLRPSGTEALLRVMVEGPSEAEIKTVAEAVAGVVRRVGGA